MTKYQNNSNEKRSVEESSENGVYKNYTSSEDGTRCSSCCIYKCSQNNNSSSQQRTSEPI